MRKPYRLLTIWQVERDYHPFRLLVIERGFEKHIPTLRSRWIDSKGRIPISKAQLDNFYNHPERCGTKSNESLRTIAQRSLPLHASELSRELDKKPIPVLIFRRPVDSTRFVLTAFIVELMAEILDCFTAKSDRNNPILWFVCTLYDVPLTMMVFELSTIEKYSYEWSTIQFFLRSTLLLSSVTKSQLLSTVFNISPLWDVTHPLRLSLFAWSLLSVIISRVLIFRFHAFLSSLKSNDQRSKHGFCRTISFCVSVCKVSSAEMVTANALEDLWSPHRYRAFYNRDSPGGDSCSVRTGYTRASCRLWASATERGMGK
jgi:hypothetical protein